MDKIKIFLFGISGKMGKNICECAAANNCEVIGGFDIVSHPTIPTFNQVENVNADFDVIIDFSRPEILSDIIKLAKKSNRPAVLCSTGYNKEQQEQINMLSEQNAVFQSGNMSIGINILTNVLSQVTKLLYDDYDVEIIEKHHNQKVDAPSGTAIMLANSVKAAASAETPYVMGRQGISQRKKNDIGIHAVRGGTIVGEHDVMFCGNDEIITFSHSAGSRKIFANGALKAAKFLTMQSAGKYDMNNLIKLF